MIVSIRSAKPANPKGQAPNHYLSISLLATAIRTPKLFSPSNAVDSLSHVKKLSCAWEIYKGWKQTVRCCAKKSLGRCTAQLARIGDGDVFYLGITQ
jgi:hypothetical protein